MGFSLWCLLWLQNTDLGVHGFSNCGTRASLTVAHRLSCPAAYGILVPQAGIEPVSPVLEGGFLSTGPPGKSLYIVYLHIPCFLINT